MLAIMGEQKNRKENKGTLGDKGVGGCTGNRGAG